MVATFSHKKLQFTLRAITDIRHYKQRDMEQCAAYTR